MLSVSTSTVVSTFDTVMVPLEYCQQCRDAAQAASISERWQRYYLKPCGSCAELRTVLLNKMRRDYFYRLHLTKISSNLPCTEKCPQHVGDRQVYKPKDMPFEAYEELTETSFKKFRRQSLTLFLHLKFVYQMICTATAVPQKQMTVSETTNKSSFVNNALVCGTRSSIVFTTKASS